MKKETQSLLLWVAGILLVVGGLFIWIRSNAPVVTEANYPIDRFELRKQGDKTFADIYLDKGVKYEEVMDMSYFSPLVAGNSQEYAVNKIGLPSNTRDLGTTKIMEFDTEKYRLDVVLIGNPEGDEYWIVSNPKSLVYEDYFIDSVAKYISNQPKELNSMTFYSDKQMLTVELEGNRVADAIWRDYN